MPTWRTAPAELEFEAPSPVQSEAIVAAATRAAAPALVNEKAEISLAPIGNDAEQRRTLGAQAATGRLSAVITIIASGAPCLCLTTDVCAGQLPEIVMLWLNAWIG